MRFVVVLLLREAVLGVESDERRECYDFVCASERVVDSCRAMARA